MKYLFLVLGVILVTASYPQSALANHSFSCRTTGSGVNITTTCGEDPHDSADVGLIVGVTLGALALIGIAWWAAVAKRNRDAAKKKKESENKFVYRETILDNVNVRPHFYIVGDNITAKISLKYNF